MLKLNCLCIRRQKTLETCEFKTALFDNSETEDILYFNSNFNMTIEASGTLNSGAEIQYLLMLLLGESLCQFDTFYVEVGSDTL